MRLAIRKRHGDFFLDMTVGLLQYFSKDTINAQCHVNRLGTSFLPLVDHADGLLEDLRGNRHYCFKQDKAPVETARTPVMSPYCLTAA